MKHCPMCAEEIQDAAKKCKHCGEYLEDATNPVGETAEVKSTATGDSKGTVYKDDGVEITEGAVIANGVSYQIKQLEKITVTELTILARMFLWVATAFFGFFAFIMIGSIGEYPVHFFVPAILAGGCGYSAVTKKTKWRIMAKQGLQEPTLYESYDKAKVEEVAAIIRGQM